MSRPSRSALVLAFAAICLIWDLPISPRASAWPRFRRFWCPPDVGRVLSVWAMGCSAVVVTAVVLVVSR